MNRLTTLAARGNADRTSWNSDDLVAELTKYAFVDVFHSETNDTFSAKATMRIKTPGAEFTVASGFRHPTMKAALTKLLSLVENAWAEAGRRG